MTGKVYDREQFDSKPWNTSKNRDKKSELPLEPEIPKQVTWQWPLICECIFQSNVKCEFLDFYMSMNEFWELSVMCEKSQYFYINAFCEVA